MLAWLNHLFSYTNNRELLQDISQADEGFDAEGRSHVCRRLLSRGRLVRIPPEQLARYDSRVTQMESGKDGIREAEFQAGQERPVPPESLALLDWQDIYMELLEYKQSKDWDHYALSLETLREIMQTTDPVSLHSLCADDALLRPKSSANLMRLHEVAVTLLRKYLDKFYRIQQARWESEHLHYEILNKDDTNFQDCLLRIQLPSKSL